MAKRIISFLLLAGILFITACSEAPQLMSFINENDKGGTYDGLTLYFKASMGPTEKDDTATTWLGYTQNTNFADMARARLEEVEKKLDINIELSKECPDGFLNDVIFLLASGGGKLDASIGMGYEDFSMKDLKLALTPMSAVSQYIDIYDSAKWGAPERLEMFAWDNEIYGVIPNYWPELQFASSDFILVPNIDYIKSINQEDPRDFFENGVWTLEKLEELIPIYSNITENKTVYGYSANERHLYELLMQYYGTDSAVKDVNGVWVAGCLTAEGRQAAQKLRDFQTGALSDNIYLASVGDQSTLWEKSEIAISTMHTVSLTDPNSGIVSVGYEYGVLPFPSPDGQSIFGQYERNVEAIFITSFTNHAEAVAHAISEIYEPFEGYETTDALKDIYNTSIFFDERDTEIIFKLAESLRVLPQAPRASDLNYHISEELNKSEVSAVLEKYASLIQSVLEEEFIPVKETMEHLFPGYND